MSCGAGRPTNRQNVLTRATQSPTLGCMTNIPPLTENLHARVPAGCLDRWRAAAAREHRSLAGWLRMVLDEAAMQHAPPLDPVEPRAPAPRSGGIVDGAPKRLRRRLVTRTEVTPRFKAKAMAKLGDG